MVILGGATICGSILGGFIIWFFWVEVEYIGLFLMDILTWFWMIMLLEFTCLIQLHI